MIAAYSTTAVPSTKPVCSTAEPCNVQALLKRYWDDRTLCRSVAQRFSEQAAGLLAALERALAASDALDLARQAHRIKGMAANLSAGELTAAAALLERTVRGGNLEPAETMVERVQAEAARVIAALPQLLAQLEEPQ